MQSIDPVAACSQYLPRTALLGHVKAGASTAPCQIIQENLKRRRLPPSDTKENDVIYGRESLHWDDSTLRLGGKGRALLRIVPDGRYPDMWRVKLPTGGLSEMANRTRVRDAAISHALMLLNNRQETGTEAPPVRSNQSNARLGRRAA